MRRDNVTRRKRQGNYVGLVADLGLTFNEMYLEWLKRAYTEINESDDAAWEATGTAALID